MSLSLSRFETCDAIARRDSFFLLIKQQTFRMLASLCRYRTVKRIVCEQVSRLFWTKWEREVPLPPFSSILSFTFPMGMSVQFWGIPRWNELDSLVHRSLLHVYHTLEYVFFIEPNYVKQQGSFWNASYRNPSRSPFREIFSYMKCQNLFHNFMHTGFEVL